MSARASTRPSELPTGEGKPDDGIRRLPDRTSETFAARLREHPGTRIVCRDRATAYSEAVRTAAPDGIQVADRFHLWKNLAEAVEKRVVAHRGCLTEPAPAAAGQPATPIDPPADAVPAALTTGKRAENTRQRHCAVHELSDKGVGTSKIAALLGMDHKTVLRYARAALLPT
ncbi:transposase [Actinosynnema sp. NPDC051121]